MTSPLPWSTYRSSGNDEVVLSADNKPVALNCSEDDARLITDVVNTFNAYREPEIPPGPYGSLRALAAQRIDGDGLLYLSRAQQDQLKELLAEVDRWIRTAS